MRKSGTNSYRDILRSSSIIGGAQGLNYLVALVRVKIVAMLLGPAGVGLISLYISVVGLVETVSGMGIGNSGVREVALSFSQQDLTAAARTVKILQRACWVTGIIGWGMAVAFSEMLSVWVSGSTQHAIAIAILGSTVLLASLHSGQNALLQGGRRIGDIARASIVAMLLNTVVTIGLYAYLGQRGIVPVLIATAGISFGVSWWYARRIKLMKTTLSWPASFLGARRLAGLGMAFMWSALLIAGLNIATRGYITRELGIEAAGLYQAAWSISGLFAGFILSAMGTDFYPRLSSVIHNHKLARSTVNEQTEIGMLMALPGLLGTLAFAPWMMELFYTKQFLPASELLPWFVIGIFGRIISWPLGYIQLAQGAARWFVVTETIFIGIQFILLLWAVPIFGLIGVAYVFAITYFLYALAMLWVAKILIKFNWSAGVKKLLLFSGLLTLIGLIVSFASLGRTGIVAGGLITLAGTFVSVRGLSERLGTDHRLVKTICSIPGGKWLTQSKPVDK